MADKRIKGITIEIGGETTGLQKALSEVNKKSSSLTQELKDVERLLKFNPENVEALAQKQRLLSEQVEVTSNKLKQLKDAEEQVQAQFKKGDISEQQYRSFRREIEFTEGSLGKLKSSLASVNNGAPLKDLAKDAENAKESVGDLGGAFEGLAGTLVAGGGIAGTISSALDTSSINTQIDISFDVPEESKKVIKAAIKDVESYGVDAEAALEGVRRQWALNKDATDETNRAVIEGASTIAKNYAGIDFTELIQETNEISKELNISNQEALGLTNALLKMGFPSEQLDIIAEYGKQLHDAGYNAAEIQALFAAGVETGTWNIDNLLDGLKEGRIKMAEFGQEIPKALDELLKKTDISSKQVQTWGQAVAKGGEDGSKAMTEIAKALNGVENETLKNSLGVQIFGTLYEEQGQNIIDTLLNAQNATVDLKANQDQLNESTAKLNADPAVQLQQAFSNLKSALEPLLLKIAEFVSQVATWVSENPKLAATIAAIVTALGILVGVFLVLSPILSGLAVAAGLLNIGLLPLIGIIAGVVAAIGLLIAAGIAIYKNWDEIKAKAVEVWGSISEWFGLTLESIKQTFSSIWESITSYLTTTWANITTSITQTWESIKQTTSDTWNSIVSAVLSILIPFINGIMNLYNGMKDGLQKVFDGLKQYFTGVWNFIKNIFLGAVLLIVDLVTGDFEGLKNDAKAIFENMKNALRDIWEGLKQIFSGALSAIKGFVSAAWENIKTNTTNTFNAIRDKMTEVWNSIKTTATNLPEQIRTTVSSKFEALKTAISEKMTAAKVKVEEIWNNIKSFFEGIDLSQIGKDIIQGLIDGITEKGTALLKKAQEIAESIKKTLKNVLDINSPSRETAKIGKFIGEGLIVGMEQSIRQIEYMSKRMATASIPNVNQGSATLNGATGAAVVSGDTYGDIHLSISVKDMQEFNSVMDIFKYLKQNVKAK
jgi:phage-related minor tail protein